VADIEPFLDGRSFDDETMRVIGNAFDAALRQLHDRRQPFAVREIIAGRVIHFVAMGERDPEQAARRALEELGIPPRN
jgi:hypothetical protein